ncbi:SdpI family protein [Sphaerochaeta sp. PS]|uniref:SdpI family protein n=1 Tax=Sphaerochaeta sp. PS TaxID=3076336 RepID=UPI0028A49076|nr:SdpI family protein [Sphaerochaeta sp. PS]MDT4761969.1 SdpI family protein [Sphaerochaeta sp. PS]
MKRTIDKTLILTTLVCLSPIAISLLFYDKLPERIPIHFNLAGEADNYASKNFAAFALPSLFALGNILLQVIMNNDPKKAAGQPLRTISKWILPIVSLLIISMPLVLSGGHAAKLDRIGHIAIALVFLVVGNYLPKCKQNYVVGIKLPWTLASEENWNRTHRFAGWLWSAASILLLISALGGWYVSLVFPLSIASMLLGPVLYSFRLYKTAGGENLTDRP